MSWSKPKYKGLLKGFIGAMLITSLSACSTVQQIKTEEGYDRGDYIVPQNGKILVSGETSRWLNSESQAKKIARYNAFHQAMMYTDSRSVSHYIHERNMKYQLGKGNEIKQGYSTSKIESDIVIHSKAIPARVLNNIERVDCYRKKQDLRYKFRCLALVNVVE